MTRDQVKYLKSRIQAIRNQYQWSEPKETVPTEVAKARLLIHKYDIARSIVCNKWMTEIGQHIAAAELAMLFSTPDIAISELSKLEETLKTKFKDIKKDRD